MNRTFRLRLTLDTTFEAPTGHAAERSARLIQERAAGTTERAVVGARSTWAHYTLDDVTGGHVQAKRDSAIEKVWRRRTAIVMQDALIFGSAFLTGEAIANTDAIAGAGAVIAFALWLRDEVKRQLEARNVPTP